MARDGNGVTKDTDSAAAPVRNFLFRDFEPESDGRLTGRSGGGVV